MPSRFRRAMAKTFTEDRAWVIRFSPAPTGMRSNTGFIRAFTRLPARTTGPDAPQQLVFASFRIQSWCWKSHGVIAPRLFIEVVGRLDKEQLGFAERLVESKPTWWNSFGCSATSAFFVFGATEWPQRPRVTPGQSQRETYHVHRRRVDDACGRRLGGCVFGSRLLSPDETKVNLKEKESPSWVARQTW